jgi:hypothetical protein
MPIILATQEVEICKDSDLKPAQVKSSQDPISPNKKWAWPPVPVIPAAWEV